MSDSVKERTMQFIRCKGITMKKFEALCNLSTGYVTSMRKGYGNNKLNNVLTAFPELNRDWLLYGEGEMLKPSVDIGTSDTTIVVSDDYKPRMIPFYDAETTGGFGDMVSSSTEAPQLVGYIQPGDWFDGKDTAAIRHVGDSMTEYPNGCVLAVREVLDRRLLVPGQNYVIETSEYRITKRIQRGSSRNTIALYSTNMETYPDGRLVYEPFEIELEDVRRIYKVLGYIVNQSGDYRLIKP